VQGALIADYFVKVLNAKKAAVVYENTSELVPGKDAFVNRIEKRSVARSTYQQAIQARTTTTRAWRSPCRVSGATATWLYMAPTPAAKIANQSEAAGYTPIWFANSISWASTSSSRWHDGAEERPRLQSVVTAERSAAPRRIRTSTAVRTTPRPTTSASSDGYRRDRGRRAAPHPNPLGQNSSAPRSSRSNTTPTFGHPCTLARRRGRAPTSSPCSRSPGGAWVLEHDFTSSF